MLFKKENKGFLVNEVPILGPDYVDELDDDFTVQEVRKQQRAMLYQLRRERCRLLTLKELKCDETV